MLGNHTLHNAKYCWRYVSGCCHQVPSECGVHDGCQIVSCHQVFSTVVHHPVEVFPEVLEEEVVIC